MIIIFTSPRISVLSFALILIGDAFELHQVQNHCNSV